MKRKILCLMLAVSMLTCLSGCGGNQKESKSSEASKNSNVAEETKQIVSSSTEEAGGLEEKTIQIWLRGPGKQRDSEKVWEVFNEKLQEYVPNTTVEFTIIPIAEYQTKYQQMLAAKEPVDLVWVGNAIGNAFTMIDNGEFMDVTSIVEEHGQGILESLGENAINLAKGDDGRIYHITTYQGLSHDRYAYSLPTEIVELTPDGWVEKTQEVVTKWRNTPYTNENYQAVFDQFDIYFNAAKEAGKLYSGLDVNVFMGGGYSQNAFGRQILSNTGIEMYDDTFTVVDTIQTDAFRLYAENMVDYYKKGYIRSDIASLNIATGGDLSFVKNGEYTKNTTILNKEYYIGDYRLPVAENNAGVDLTMITIEDRPTLTRGESSAMAVPYCADEPERAIMVLNALYTEPELYHLLHWGIEGEHYTFNANGTITTPYGSNPTADDAYGLYNWIIGTMNNTLYLESDIFGFMDEVSKIDANAYVNPLATLRFDDSSVADIKASLKAIDNEYFQQIQRGYLGDQWDEVLDKWIAERKAAGVDEFIAEYQRQINEFIKKNNITSW